MHKKERTRQVNKRFLTEVNFREVLLEEPGTSSIEESHDGTRVTGDENTRYKCSYKVERSHTQNSCS